MVQYVNIDGNTIAVDASCNHPEERDNTCPTRKGNCEDCRYCIATMTYADYLKLRAKVLQK